VLRQRAQCQVLTFGTSSSSDLVWRVESVDAFGVVTATFEFRGESATVTPALAGVHMVSNAAAAVLVGVACGMSFTVACSGVGQEIQEFGRMVWLANSNGQRILDDSYNANEASMLAALRVLAAASGEKKFAVLGRMAEVADSQGAHRTVAEFAQQVGVRIIPLETDLYGVASRSLDDVINELKHEPWDSLLVKGSRSAATERVVQALLK
jgi:UDP-N-acetylmuramoyl-tripeptide--D-alanyl-D-alanine ligase